MKIKRVLAMGLVVTMVGGMNMVTLADSLPSGAQSIVSGSGELEGYVNSEITKVTVPTSAVTSNFILDPQGLLGVADNTTYTGGKGAVYFTNGAQAEVKYAAGDTVTAVEGDGSVTDAAGNAIAAGEFYFAAADSKNYKIDATAAGSYTLTADGTNDANVVGTVVKTAAATGTYSNKSDAIQIINKSSYPIDVKIDVDLKKTGGTALDKISLVEKDALVAATAPSLYFGVEIGTDETAIVDGNKSVTASAKAIPFISAAVNYAAGDVVYMAAAPSTPVTSGTKDTDWFAESGDGHNVAYTLTADDTAIVGQVKSAAVADGYELKSFADADAATAAGATNVVTGKSGKVYGYALSSGFTAFTDQTVSFKLTGATNDVAGWGEVAETVSAAVTYTLTKQGGVSYTEEVCGGANWGAGGVLWLSPDGTNGFANSTLTVEFSADGSEGGYTSIQATQNSDNWVSVKWSDLQAAGCPDAGYTVRVTDGTTRYTYTR